MYILKEVLLTNVLEHLAWQPDIAEVYAKVNCRLVLK